MFNNVHVEGIVTGGCWAYDDMQFVRIACYPDPGRRPRRASRTGSGRGHRTTSRCAASVSMRWRWPAATRAIGCRRTAPWCYRDGDISLGSFVDKARGPQPALAALRELAQAAGAEVTSAYVLIEVLLERLVISERAPRTGDAAPPRGWRAETAGRGQRVRASEVGRPVSAAGCAVSINCAVSDCHVHTGDAPAAPAASPPSPRLGWAGRRPAAG